MPGSPAYVPGSPAYVPGSPAYVPGEESNSSPKYKNTTPELAPQAQGGAGPPGPPTAGTKPPALQIGGKRSTRKRRETSMLDFAMNFKGIWDAHARSK